MALKDLTKLVEDSMLKKDKIEVVEIEHDILHEDAKSVDLGALIEEFYSEKAIIDAHKKRVDALNSKIKEVMILRKLEDYEAGGYEAVLSIQNRSSLNEDSLIDKLRDMGRNDLIMQKDVPNVEMIEDNIYNNEFNPVVLADCMEYKTVHTLKVKQKKKSKK